MPKVASGAANKKQLEFYQKAPEVSIFMVCYAIRNRLLELEQERKADKLTQKAFQKKFNTIYRQFVQAVEATHRFDIIVPASPVMGNFSVFFWRWFNWWDDYLKGLPSHVIEKLRVMAEERHPSTERYRPTDDWLYYRSTPCFTITVED